VALLSQCKITVLVNGPLTDLIPPEAVSGIGKPL